MSPSDTTNDESFIIVTYAINFTWQLLATMVRLERWFPIGGSKNVYDLDFVVCFLDDVLAHDDAIFLFGI